MIARKDKRPQAAIITAARTPFCKAGTNLSKTHVTQLGRLVIQEVLYRASWPAEKIDEVILGNVVMPADATNPARVAALWAGIPQHVPALTVQRNCASGMEALAEAALRIESGRARAIVAGGAESMSNIPLLFPDETMGVMARLYKARSPIKKLIAALSMRPRHFKPIAALELGLTDPTCGMIMGKTAEVLAHEFGIGRVQQDEYALESHIRAFNAADHGAFDDEIITVYPEPKFNPVTADNGPRQQQTMAALAKLKPYFDRRDGSVTVGNACQVTDGAAAALVMDSDLAETQGLTPLGYIRSYAYVGLDPSRMGLGPVYAIARLLDQTGLSLGDIDLFEINEAFAVQILACMEAMNSKHFARTHLNRDKPLGELNPRKLNVNGGAIALGHPVGATGTRIATSVLMQMQNRDAQFGIAALCVGGGQGAAMLLERRPS